LWLSKKREWIDETGMEEEEEEEEGKRLKDEVGRCIYRKRKEVASSGHKLMVSCL